MRIRKEKPERGSSDGADAVLDDEEILLVDSGAGVEFSELEDEEPEDRRRDPLRRTF